MFAWLRLTTTLPLHSLRSLRLDAVHTEDDTRAVAALLQTLGPDLQHLTIGCPFNYDTPMRTHFDHFINISGNTGLISLRLLVTSLETYNLPWVLSILEQLASRRITEVALEVPLFYEHQLEDMTWHEIVAKLRKLNLRKVEVVHRGMLEWEKAKPAIRKCFDWVRLPTSWVPGPITPILNIVNDPIDYSG
ncbi:hypothetical protein B0H21DRAFT_753747 [Amylocystis lapponica]|nr:hypothetical protein B0H21DRAFT_753747 [Amylocystis lapponica]